MAFVGLILAMLGFLLSVASLGLTSSVTGRMTMVLIGILIRLVGIIGFINRAYMKNAIWRK